MSTVEITAGSTEPLEAYARAAAGGALTGSSNLRVQIRRVADGFFYDFNDSTFKSSGWTTRQATLSEIDGTNAPGEYRLTGGVDTTGWAAGSYAVTFLEVSTSLVANGPQFATGEIRVVTATPSALSARIPAALVSGRMDASVGAVANDAITAASIADGAIDAGAIASDAITSAKIADGTITAAKLADNAITSAKIAADAIGTSQLAAGAITSTEAPALANLDVAVSTRASQASVDAIGAAPSAASIADAVCDELLSEHTTTGSVGEALGRLDATVSSRLAAASYSAPPSAAAIASQVWSTALPGAFSAGSGGYLVGTYLDAAVSSRLPTSSYAAAPSAAAIATQVLGTAIPGAFGVGSLGYVIGTNLDVVVSTRLASSAYAAAPTAAAVADAVWDEPLAGHATAGSTGAKLAEVTSASSVATAVWATVDDGPAEGTFGFYVKRVFQLGFNRLELDSVGGGRNVLYDDDASTVIATFTLRDVAGGSLTLTTGAPARRGMWVAP